MSDALPLPPTRFLTRPQAASYVGVSPRTFDAEVTTGIWPAPMRRGGKGGTLTWDRRLLDRAADRMAGLVAQEAAGADVSAGEQAALEASRNGTTASNRRQHRHQAAS